MFGHFIKQYIHDFIVRHLSNSKSFQKMALKIDSTIKNRKEDLQETAEIIKDQIPPVHFSPTKFIEIFREELKKEFSKKK